MMDMILVLSQRVNAQAEVAHQHVDAPAPASPDPTVQNFTIDQAVQQRRLEMSVRQAPLVADSMSDDPSSSEEGPITRRRKAP